MNTNNNGEAASTVAWEIPEFPADSDDTPTDALNIVGLFGKPKVEIAPEPTYPDQPKGFRPANGNWLCRCGIGNKAEMQHCSDCGTLRKIW